MTLDIMVVRSNGRFLKVGTCEQANMLAEMPKIIERVRERFPRAPVVELRFSNGEVALRRAKATPIASG